MPRATAGRRHRLRDVLIALAAYCLILPLCNIQAMAQSGGARRAWRPRSKALRLNKLYTITFWPIPVLIESLQRAKAQAEAQQAAMTKSKISTFKNELVDDPNAPILGNPKGDVTLVESSTTVARFAVRSNHGSRL